MLRVSPYSHKTAAQFVDLIHRQAGIPRHLRDAFESSSAFRDISITNPGANSPAAIPLWFQDVHAASWNSEWVITTACAHFVPTGRMLEPDDGGDPSYRMYRYSNRVRTELSRFDVADHTTLGRTCASEAIYRRSPNSFMHDEFATTSRGTQAISVSTPLVPGIDGHRGLIIVCDRARQDGGAVPILDAVIANSFIHELACHAGPISNPGRPYPLHGTDASSAPTEADIRARMIDALVPNPRLHTR